MVFFINFDVSKTENKGRFAKKFSSLESTGINFWNLKDNLIHPILKISFAS